MRINVHAGHGADGSKSCGAIGLIKESTENRNVKNEVMRLLKQEGCTVFDTSCDYPASSGDCINKIVKKCNANKVDLDVSIHFNSGAKDKNGNGVTTGVEVLVYDNKSCYTQATRIVDRISKLGYRNRGVKIRTDLGVLRNTKAPALLVECCFVDDRDDVNKYNYKTMAKAIVEGILNKNINSNQVENKPWEEFDMDKIVLYYGDADLFGAVMVAQKHKCPLMKKNDFDNSGLKTKEIIQIGGKKEDTDRFTTFKNAAKLV